MWRNECFLLVTAALVALAETSWSQPAPEWRTYKMADSLPEPEPACASITFSPRGKVFARHRSSGQVILLDGHSVSRLPSPGPDAGRIYESRGQQLWTASRDGLKEFKEDTRVWETHPIREIIDEFRTRAPSPSTIPLYPVKRGEVIFMLTDRIMEFKAANTEDPGVRMLRAANQTQLEQFSGMTAARDGGLWISGKRGIAKVLASARNAKLEKEWREYLPPQSLQIHNFQEPIEDEDGGVTCVAESIPDGKSIVACFDGQSWTVHTVGPDKLKAAWRGRDRLLWAATGQTLYRQAADGSERWENAEISARQFFDVAVEPGGLFWLATSDGIFRYSPPLWRTPWPVETITAATRCLTEDAQGRLWFVAGNTLNVLDNNIHREYPLPEKAGQDPERIRGLFPLKDQSLLLLADNALFQFHPASTNTPEGRFEQVLPPDSNARLIPVGLLKDGTFCFQKFDQGASADNYALETFDGATFQPFAHARPPLSGEITALLNTQNGDLWMAGQRGTAWLHNDKWRAFPPTPDHPVTRFAEMADGKIWCATPETIREFDGANWQIVRAGLDTINSIVRTRDGSVWVGWANGLQRLTQGTWIEIGMEEGLPASTVLDLLEDSRGQLWAGTTYGITTYHPEADPDFPNTSLEILTDKAINIPHGSIVTLTFSAQDKWKYTSRDRLLFSHRMDDGEWSPFLESRTASFAELKAGRHYFQVRAMDRNGNIDPSPAPLTFGIFLPWYKESRLVMISIAGTALALFFAAVAFNRHRRLVRSYAEVEQKVAERTHELELANRELLQSQKMTALGTLAAGIAHDFNNILSIIKGSAQIIEDNLHDPNKIGTRVDRIKTVVEQGSGIVTAMLGFSRTTQDAPALCDLNAAVEETIKLLGDRFLREVEVSFEPAHDLPPVRAGRDFIQQILLNFIFNAAESMDRGKEVILSTRRLEKLPEGLIMKPPSATQYLAVSVRDFGCGIPAENLTRIFDPFFTTKALSTRRGTGLGLSMVYELAKKLGAGLAVESAVNLGSTFTLILPVQEAQPEAQPEPAKPQPMTEQR